MENATKALLIAAAVLIAIVLVALGVNLLNSAGDTSDEAAKVANQLDKTTGNAANGIVSDLNGLDIIF